jgi:hypothetical protein
VDLLTYARPPAITCPRYSTTVYPAFVSSSHIYLCSSGPLSAVVSINTSIDIEYNKLRDLFPHFVNRILQCGASDVGHCQDGDLESEYAIHLGSTRDTADKEWGVRGVIPGDFKLNAAQSGTISRTAATASFPGL